MTAHAKTSFDYWLRRIDQRDLNIFIKYDKMRQLHARAIRRWGPDDKRTKWYEWRLEKIEIRERAYYNVCQRMYDACFEDKVGYDRVNQVIREARCEPSRSLRQSRIKGGLTFPRK